MSTATAPTAVPTFSPPTIADGAAPPPGAHTASRLRRVGSWVGGHATELAFWGAHVGALGVVWVGISWWSAALCVFAYAVRMFAITAGYHRYFAHRAFKTSRVFQCFLAVLGTTSAQKGPLWWAAHHRRHHRFSDQEKDLHSPKRRGFWWSHLGWILSPRFAETDWDRIRDFARFGELRWLNRYHLVPPLAGLAAIYFLLGLQAALWGGLVSTVCLWHGTFFINSLAHVFGRRVYRTTDTSRNSLLLALITLGEGWHNNHHYYQASANQGFRWYEIDVTFYILCLLEKLGIVWDLKRAPAEVVAGRLAGRNRLLAAR